MGIPKFRGQVTKNLKVGYNDAKPGTYPTKVSGLMLDFNDLLHFYAQKVYLYGLFGKSATQKDINRRDKMTDAQLEDQFIKEILGRLDFYLKELNPEDYFILAVDGPVPLAKIAQQRMRRFSAKTAVSPRFDNAVLSPGTEFMEKVHLKLKKWFQINAKKDLLPRVAVYSSHHEPGEGEHKMVEMFFQAAEKLYKINPPKGMHFLCGQDGDLIMLGNLIPYSNVVHYVEDRTIEARTGVPYAEFYMFDAMKRFIYRSLLRDRTELDFVLTFFMFGNDFLPKNPAFTEANTMMKNITEAYIKNGRRLINMKTGKINREALIRFFSYFIPMEKSNLDMKAATFNPKIQMHFPILTKNTIKNKNRRIEVDLDGFKKDWYDRAIQVYNENSIIVYGDSSGKYMDINVFKRDMFENYLEMFQWNIDYYLRKPVSWNFQYKFYFAPMISDLAMLPYDGEIPRNTDDYWKCEASSLRQLIMISHPSKVKGLIPSKYHSIIDSDRIKDVSPDDPIEFPDGVREGSEYKHFYTTVLPLVSHDYFDEELSKFKGTLPPRLEVHHGEADIYIKDIEIDEEKTEEYIPGSRTRHLTSKKFEWYDGIVH